MENIDKVKAVEILSSFRHLVKSLSSFLEKELHDLVDDRGKKDVEEFLSRTRTFYPNYVKGLEEYYKEERFVELVRLADIEVYFRIAGILVKLNPKLFKDIKYAIYIKKHPKDFPIHYRRIMRLDYAEEKDVLCTSEISRKLLRETENLVHLHT